MRSLSQIIVNVLFRGSSWCKTWLVDYWLTDLEHILRRPVRDSADGSVQYLLGSAVQRHLQQVVEHLRVQLVPVSLTLQQVRTRLRLISAHCDIRNVFVERSITSFSLFIDVLRRIWSYDLDGIEICTGWAKNWTILEVNISCIWWRKKEFHVYKTVQLFIRNRPTVLLWMLSYFCISLGRPYYTKTTN